MAPVSPEIIKEIASDLDSGFKVFIHNTTYELLIFPDEDSYMDSDDAIYKENRKLLKKNRKAYDEVMKWSSSDAFEAMKEFAETLADNNRLQAELIAALNDRKPFRQFKYVIDNSGEYRKKWFEYRDK